MSLKQWKKSDMWDNAVFILPFHIDIDEDAEYFKLITDVYIACVCKRASDIYSCIALDMKKDSIATLAFKLDCVFILHDNCFELWQYLFNRYKYEKIHKRFNIARACYECPSFCESLGEHEEIDEIMSTLVRLHSDIGLF